MSEHNTSMNGWAVYRRLLRYSASYWKVFLIALAGMVVIAFAQLAFAKFIEPMLDDTFTEKDPVTIKWIPIVLISIYAVRIVGTFLSNYGMAYIARSVVRNIRSKMFTHYLCLPTTYFDTTSSGTLVSRMVYDVEQLADAASYVVTILIRDSLTIIVLLGFMFTLSVELTLLLLITLPILLVLVLYVSKRFRTISRRI